MIKGEAREGGRVALPVAATSKATEVVERRDGSVVLTPTSGAAIRRAASDPFVWLAADTDGRFVVPGFMPAFDAIATFVSLLDMLVVTDRPLSEVVDRLPETHIATR